MTYLEDQITNEMNIHVEAKEGVMVWVSDLSQRPVHKRSCLASCGISGRWWNLEVGSGWRKVTGAMSLKEYWDSGPSSFFASRLPLSQSLCSAMSSPP